MEGAGHRVVIASLVDETLPGLVQGVRRSFGPIYGLVNNAAIGTEGLLAIMHNSQIETLVNRSIGGPGHFDDLVRGFVVRFPAPH